MDISTDSIKEPLHVIFGGSFDPFHKGHIQIIATLLTQRPIEKIWVIPAFLNPFKQKNFFTAKERLHWIRASLIDQPKDRVNICPFELRQFKSTPTFTTVMHLKNLFPDKSLAVVIGEDQLFALRNWFCFELLKEEVIFFIFGRKGFLRYPRDILEDIRYIWVDFDIKISATMIREALLSGDKCVKKYLSPYIIHDILSKFKFY